MHPVCDDVILLLRKRVEFGWQQLLHILRDGQATQWWRRAKETQRTNRCCSYHPRPLLLVPHSLPPTITYVFFEPGVRLRLVADIDNSDAAIKAIAMLDHFAVNRNLKRNMVIRQR